MQLEPSTTNEKRPQASCRECEGLRAGTRSSQNAHEYLVRTSYSEASGASTYTCLLCRGSMVNETDGTVRRWR